MSILKVIDSVLKKLLGKLHYILNDPRITIITMQTINATNKKQEKAKIIRQNEQRVRI